MEAMIKNASAIASKMVSSSELTSTINKIPSLSSKINLEIQYVEANAYSGHDLSVYSIIVSTNKLQIIVLDFF